MRATGTRLVCGALSAALGRDVGCFDANRGVVGMIRPIRDDTHLRQTLHQCWACLYATPNILIRSGGCLSDADIAVLLNRHARFVNWKRLSNVGRDQRLAAITTHVVGESSNRISCAAAKLGVCSNDTNDTAIV